MSAPILWGPNSTANNLQSNLGFSSGAGPTIQAPSSPVNPTVTATAGSPGDMYLNNTIPAWFQKQDSGTTTNWKIVAGYGTGSAPTVQRFTSGSGTYTTPTNPAPAYIKVRLVGGGGGGASSGVGGPNPGSNGTASSFGSSFLTAGGGNGATVVVSTVTSGGVGGVNTINSGGITLASVSGGGGGAGGSMTTAFSLGGAVGGSSVFGGAGYGGAGQASTSGAGGSAGPNSGSGGGGGGATTTNNEITGGGGGAGGYIESLITSPLSTYAYVVGPGGAGGAAGDAPGGNGASGIVIVEEYYAPSGSSSGGTGITRSVNSISSPATAAAAASTDYVYLVSGTTTLTLPTAVANTNLYTVKNSGVNTVSVGTTSAQTIDGSASPITLPVANTSLSFISDGSNWRLV